MNIQAPVSASGPGLTPGDLLVTADEFVRRGAAALGLDDLSAVEIELLAKEIRDGMSRLDALDVLIARVDPDDPRLSRPNPAFLKRDLDAFIIVDLLERYALDDDREFARFVMSKVLGEAPTAEALEAAQAFLWRTKDRRAFLEDLAAKRAARGERVELSSRVAPETESPRRVGANVLTSHGRFGVTIVRREPGMGWVAGDNVTIAATVEDGKWKTRRGWVVLGPKRSFEPGLWRLDVDLTQPDNACVTLDVIANAGVDVLLRATLMGPAKCSMRVDVKPWRHFVEFRLFKPEEAEESNWLDIRNLSFVRLS